MQNVKKKKMLLMLPLLIIPFLTLAFWALGGGSGTAEDVKNGSGLNLGLPDAQLKEDKLLDKLSFYEKADKDSLKMQEWMRSDPYFKRDSIQEGSAELEELAGMTGGKYGQRLNTSLYEKPPVSSDELVMKKLKELQAQINEPPVTKTSASVESGFSSDLDRLELMMQSNGRSTEDAELNQLQGTLDKILDIQHPSRIKERSVKNKEAVYAVRSDKGTDTLVKGFYSYSDKAELEGQEQNAIEAIVATTQAIVNGAVVKLRLINDIYVRGQLIAKNTLVSGVAALEGERLTVAITSIRSGKSIYSVKLEVYDMDGLPGIYIPGTINREVAKESLNNSLSLADVTSLDPSFKAQATAAGIGTLKSLVSKKAKLVRVQLKAGYKVLLNNKNQNP